MSQEVELYDRTRSNASDTHDGELQATTSVPSLIPTNRARQLTVLVSSFLTVALTIGLNQAYGVFLGYYVNPSTTQKAFLPPSQTENKALVAFIGTLGAGLTWGGSIFVNPLMARTKSLKAITVPGALLISLGYLLAGSCHQVRRCSYT